MQVGLWAAAVIIGILHIERQTFQAVDLPCICFTSPHSSLSSGPWTVLHMPRVWPQRDGRQNSNLLVKTQLGGWPVGGSGKQMRVGYRCFGGCPCACRGPGQVWLIGLMTPWSHSPPRVAQILCTVTWTDPSWVWGDVMSGKSTCWESGIGFANPLSSVFWSLTPSRSVLICKVGDQPQTLFPGD